MSKQLPEAVNHFRKRHPKVWKSFNKLGERCHEAGPLDEKSRRLVKLAMSIAAGLEGATHSALRRHAKLVSPRARLITLRSLRLAPWDCPQPLGR